MSAGRTQLSGIGQQDMYLTGNPQITHFKAVYRRHTNFAVETYKLTFNTNPTEVDNTIEAFISKNGDLLTGMWLEATLKQDKTTPTTYDYINWCNNTGAAYIEECKFYIGPHKIDHYTSTFSDIHNELTDHNQYEHMGLNKHMAKKGYLKSNSNSLNNLLLNIPLKFWFCRNNGLALPLCALKFSEIKVEIKLRSLKKLINHSANAGGAITMTAPNNNVVLYANYVHLDDEEKKRFTTQPLEYLIEQVQFQENKVLESNVKFFFSHPVKEIFWVIRNNTRGQSAEAGGISAGVDATLNTSVPNTSSSFPGNVQKNDYFNYMCDATSGTLNSAISDMGNLYGNDACEWFKSAAIKFNGGNRTPDMSPYFFRVMQPLQAKHRVPTKHIYCYSFALTPEDYNPSGTANFSKISNSEIEFKQLNASDETTNSKRISIYAINYNILRISGGMGGIAYSN
jgi:hypothetical protein